MTTTRHALASAKAAVAGELARTVERQPAPKVVVLPPSAFSAEWSKRPTERVKIGLRLVSEATTDQARAEALAAADGHYRDDLSRTAEQYVEHYNGELVRGILAQACCQPDDVERPWFEKTPNMLVRIALTEGGVLRLWQAYLELREQQSPLLRVATDHDLAELGAMLAGDARARVTDIDRRILGRILDELKG